MMISAKLPRRVPIVLMTSFARSGETLLQRSLNAHPRIMTLQQIKAGVDPAARKILNKIRQSRSTSVWLPGKFAAKRGGPGTLLLVKNGVWTHHYPYRGFVLARNPFSIVASMKRYAIDHLETEEYRRSRLARWAKGIAPSLVKATATESETILLAQLYLKQMSAALDTGHLAIRYEDFINDPEAELRRIVACLGLPWDDRVLSAEKDYPEGEIGHGGIELWKPIRTGLPVYSGGLSHDEFAAVAEITGPVLSALNYHDIKSVNPAVAESA
jgi:hypothetical protein